MVEFYKHNSDPRFFYAKYTNGVYSSYVEIWENEFFKRVDLSATFIAVFNYEDAFLVEKEFYSKSAKLASKLSYLFTDSVFVGLKGIQTFFLRCTFSLLLPMDLFVMLRKL